MAEPSQSVNLSFLMTSEDFLVLLQNHTERFADAVSTKEGDWIIKGFIDIFKKICTVSVDTKIISKVLELLLLPMFVDFSQEHDLDLELCPQQNFYPDLTFKHRPTGRKFAVDVKSTYRTTKANVNGMTLGAFTGYFRRRDSNKNVLYPYEQYSGHFVLGVIYDKCDEVVDERRTFSLEDLGIIPSVVRNFTFFAQPKYRVASSRPGSGNTKNIGSIFRIPQLLDGSGPFAALGEEIYDDYWMYYQTKDMARALEMERPYKNLAEYLSYKNRGAANISEEQKKIAEQADVSPDYGDIN